MKEISKLYTMKEVGQILKLHPATLKAWVADGRLRAIKVGYEWRVTEETLSEAISTGINLKPRKVGRPKGGALLPSAKTKAKVTDKEFADLEKELESENRVRIDCGYPQAPETATHFKDESKQKKGADELSEDELLNMWSAFSDESRLLRQKATASAKQGDSDAKD